MSGALDYSSTQTSVKVRLSTHLREEIRQRAPRGGLNETIVTLLRRGLAASDVRPPIVCLCGSTRYKDLFLMEARRLTLEGVIVVMPGVFAHADPVAITAEEKSELDDLHLQKIDLCDTVHVINAEGYLGESTQREIAYARKKGKGITYLDPTQPTEGEPS